MFLVVFDCNKAMPAPELPDLKRYEFRYGKTAHCRVYADTNKVTVHESGDCLMISDRTLESGCLATIPRSGNDFRFHKPLMYGLPIYYVKTNGKLAVSSHIQLLRSIGMQLELDEAALPEFFVFRYVCPPRTLITDVYCIPLDCDLTGKLKSDNSFAADLTWTRRFSSDGDSCSFEGGVESTKDALISSVGSLEPHSDSVACLMSGGVDSSILFEIAKQKLGTRLSHSTGYPFASDAENDERNYAESAAEILEAEHTYHEFSNRSFLHSIVDAIDQSEMPLIHLQSALLCELFSKHLDPTDEVVLNGQGADGLYGLNIMFNYQHYKYLMHKPLAPLLRLASLLFSESFFPFKKFSSWAQRSWSTNFEDPQNGLWMLGVFGDIDWVESYFDASFDDIFAGRRTAIKALQADDILDAFSALDLVGDVALTQDIWGQISAQYGRRQYYVFNDPQVIAAARSVRWEDKLTEPKLLLRQAGRRLGVPSSILDRPKLGFGIQSSRWSRPGGLMEPMLELVSSTVNVELVKAFQGDSEASAMIYWNWINLGLWKRLVLNGECIDDIHTELREILDRHGF